MKRLSILVLLMIAMILPAQAQDQTIVEIASANPDFSTLVAAVGAADPAVLEALSGPGPLTVFAPTNEAFAKLLSTLNMSADDLLANQELLTQVLLYHVVSGTVLAEDVIAADGTFVPTLLEDASVGVAVVDGGVVLNDVVKVTATDIIASNGVIHVIDNVLLPQVVLDTLNMSGMMEMTPEATMEAMEPMVNIRVAHLSPDAGAVDIYVEGEVAVADLEYPTVTDFLTLPAGTYTIAVAPAGTSLEDAVIGPAEFDLPADAFITVAAVGTVADGTLAPAVTVNDFSPVAAGNARVTVFHAIADAPAVDVLADGTAIITNLAFPGMMGDNDGEFTVDVPAGTYDLAVVASGTTEPVVIDLSGTTLEEGTTYFVAAIGSLADPSVSVTAVDADTAASLRGEDMMMMEPTIAEIVANNSDFSILLAAVQAADPAVLEALSGAGPLTVFAPTNEAFTNLLTSLNMSAEDLLANEDLLTQVLLYHVVDGAVLSSDVVALDGQDVETLNGESVAVSVVDGAVMLNDNVTVTAVDMVASNGIVHVIDGVLLPQAVIDSMAQ